MNLFEKTVEESIIYEGKIVTVHRDRAELPNGRITLREVVEHPGGVVILALHEDETVDLVRQFRYPVGRVLTERPAGKLEKGEDPRLAALRELEEETGLRAGELTGFGAIYVSPGISTELLHMYLARDLRPGTLHPDEDEFLERSRVPFSELYESVLRGENEDAKTVALVLRVRAWLDEQR